MGLIRPFGAVDAVGMQSDDGSFAGLAVGSVECEAGSVADNVVPAVLIDTLCDPEATGNCIVISIELERLSGRGRGAVLGGLL